jgi:biopolymer transport protein ExbD
MIDVVFLLIIFFLVASYYLRSEQSRTVQLPAATGGREDPENPLPHLTITIEADGNWSIAGQTLSPEEAEARIQELAAAAQANQPAGEVRIRADRRVAYREVRRLIELCAAHQLRGIQFAVTSEKSQPSLGTTSDAAAP